MGRWAVVIHGALSADLLAALGEQHIARQLLAGWEHELPEPNTMVVVQASSESDAIGRVRQALKGHDDVLSFKATEYVQRA